MKGWRGTAILTAALLGPSAAAQPAPRRPSPEVLCTDGQGAPRGAWSLDDVPIADAVRRIAAEAGWRLSYSEASLPPVRVSVRCQAFDPKAAMAIVLRGTTVRALFRGDLMILAPVDRAADPTAARAVGSADDARAQALPLTMIEANRAAAIGFGMAVPAANPGGAIQTVRLDSLWARGVVTLGEALRGMAPGLVAWDRGAGALRIASVRGRGTDGGPGVKVFVDGLEVADPSAILAVDVRTLASAQWIAGPASAALYGGDALDGVLHLQTRGNAAVGGSDPVTTWSGSVRAGQAAARYRPGDLRHGDGAASATWREGPGLELPVAPGVRRTVSASASAQWSQVPLPAEPVDLASASVTAALEGAAWQVALSARGGAGRQRLAFTPRAVTPATRGGGGLDAAAMEAALDEERLRDGQFGVSGWRRTPRADHAFALSVARAIRQSMETGRRPSLQDSVLAAWQGPVTRHTARYTARVPLRRKAGAPLALQLSTDGTALRRVGPDTSGFVNALGDSTVTQTAVGGSAQLTGALGGAGWSAQWAAGVRAEWNDAFGDTTRLAWLPSLGLTVRRPWGRRGSWSVRAAYGISLRAPAPNLSAARSTSQFVQRANPGLAGERVRGSEVGVAVSGTRWSVDVGGFRQRTDGFTQLVTTGRAVRTDGAVAREVQYRGVGILLAQGVEARARVDGPWGTLEGTGSAVRSRLQSLAVGYAGPLRDGGPPLEAPTSTLAATWTRRALYGRVSITGSLLGSWQTNVFACAAASDPACDLSAAQRVAASSRWHASYERALGAGWHWRLRVENLSNNQRADGSAVLLAPGRSIGLELGRW